jgi:hypothetical protein
MILEILTYGIVAFVFMLVFVLPIMWLSFKLKDWIIKRKMPENLKKEVLENEIERQKRRLESLNKGRYKPYNDEGYRESGERESEIKANINEGEFKGQSRIQGADVNSNRISKDRIKLH